LRRLFPRSTRNFYLDVARGGIQGHTSVVVRGHNPTQTVASGFVDVSPFGDLVHLATAELMSVVSDNVADTLLGIGARTVLVEGVDASGAAIQEQLSLNGLTPVLTTQAYLRVNQVTVTSAGSSAWNVGIVTTAAAVAATTQSQILATESLSQCAFYTVPLGCTLFVTQVEMNLIRSSGAPIVTFEGRGRVGGAFHGAPWVDFYDKTLDAQRGVTLEQHFPIPEGTPTERTDIRFRTDVDLDGTETRIRMYGVLIKDGAQ